MKFGENLKKLRKLSNLSQEALAEKVKVSRQSVSKWETGEAYPEMNNLLQLCKIFHCQINDLVNDSILDLDSFNSDTKKGVAKLKKEKQQRVKKISKAIEIISKICGIICKVLLPIISISLGIFILVLANIKIENNTIVSGDNKIKITEENNNIIFTHDNRELVKYNNIDLKLLIDALREKNRTIILVTIGSILLILYVILIIKIFKYIEKLFSNIGKTKTPFTMENVQYIKKISNMLIISILLSCVGKSVLESAINKFDTTGLDINITTVISILVLFSMAYIFEYGYHIQLDSKGVMYDE